MEECYRCKEKWFDLDVEGGVCARCRRLDVQKLVDEPFLYTMDSNLDPDDNFQTYRLPILSDIEEQFIARVHILVEIRQIRGSNHCYRGHIVNLLRDTGKIYSHLPLLPRDLNIVVIRPKNTATNSRLSSQFSKDSIVRRNVIRCWLNFLISNHPGYSNVTINHANLARLPHHGSLMDDITTIDVEDVEASHDEDQDVADGLEGPTRSVVPDLHAKELQLHGLGEAILDIRGNGLGERDDTVSLDPTTKPLSEFDRSQGQGHSPVCSIVERPSTFCLEHIQ